MVIRTVPEALAKLGHPTERIPSRPILHGVAGTLASLAVPDDQGKWNWVGVWVESDRVDFLGHAPDTPGPSIGHRLTGTAARLYDLLADAGRIYLERLEEIDSQLATLQQKGRAVALADVWALQRKVAGIRAQVGRALVVAAECAGPMRSSFAGFPDALPSLSGELTRVRELAANVSQSLSDLILLRNAEDSNRLADTANQLGRVSNQIAALANISNIRMLGLSYIALVLALVAAVVLIPNTAATILGMPSAGWVPGVWVDIVITLLAVVPIVIVFTRRWVVNMLRGMMSFEGRVAEGLSDLPEVSGDEQPLPPKGAR